MLFNIKQCLQALIVSVSLGGTSLAQQRTIDALPIMAFSGGKGTFQLANGEVRNGRIQIRTSTSLTIKEEGQRNAINYQPDQLRGFTVGPDSFVVVHDLWLARYKPRRLQQHFDALDTVRVAAAFVQKHLNRNGAELLRYVDLDVGTGMVGGTMSSSSITTNDYYCYYLFRRKHTGAYRVIPGEREVLRSFFAPVVAGYPALQAYLLKASIIELRLPSILTKYFEVPRP